MHRQSESIKESQILEYFSTLLLLLLLILMHSCRVVFCQPSSMMATHCHIRVLILLQDSPCCTNMVVVVSNYLEHILHTYMHCSSPISSKVIGIWFKQYLLAFVEVNMSFTTRWTSSLPRLGEITQIGKN